jgi:hypothetical protein
MDLNRWTSEMEDFHRRLPTLVELWVSGFTARELSRVEQRRYAEFSVAPKKLARDIVSHLEGQRMRIDHANENTTYERRRWWWLARMHDWSDLK